MENKTPEKNEAEAKLEALKEAAVALVSMLQHVVSTHYVYECRAAEADCEKIATMIDLKESSPLCDYCAGVAIEVGVLQRSRTRELAIAAPLRALRAALQGS